MAIVLEKVLLPVPLGPQMHKSLGISWPVELRCVILFQYVHLGSAGYTARFHPGSSAGFLFSAQALSLIHIYVREG